MREINITKTQEGQRLDKFLLKYMNKAPKSFVYKMLRKKNIKLNGKKAEGSEIISEGDIIKLFLSDDTLSTFMQERTVEKADRDFSIIYEDENIIICRKPKGLICHPDRENKTNTLNDQLLYYLYEKGEYDISAESDFKPSICNRLDRNTSGIVIMGKNLHAVRELNSALTQRLIDKYYITLVKGRITKEGKVEGYISKNDSNISSLGEQGKYILTKYKPLIIGEDYTLLEVKLETGRSHQIRVCMTHINHPIAGDTKYGDEAVNRLFRDKYSLRGQFLHSGRIVFKIKEGLLSYLYNREFTADLYDKERNIVKKLFN